MPGLSWKIWILNHREKEAGGIYLFESERAQNDFVTGPLATQVKSHPTLTEFSAKAFDVMDEVTDVTHGRVRATVAA